MRRQTTFLVLLLIALLCLNRFARARPKPLLHSCNNTRSGLDFIADDQGFLCKRDSLEYRTGCCTSGERFDCSTCNASDSCCSKYEGCVSCCLRPDHDASRVYLTAKIYSSNVKHAVPASPFEYCMSICRTHPLSTAHENSYVSERHHCFSKRRRPLVENPLPPHSLDGVVVVTSFQNEDCNSACARAAASAGSIGGKAGRRSLLKSAASGTTRSLAASMGGRLQCSKSHLGLLNNCDQLREHFACEAGCAAATSNAMPGYMTESASKERHPSLCFKAADAATLTCERQEKGFQRLCPCVAA